MTSPAGRSNIVTALCECVKYVVGLNSGDINQSPMTGLLSVPLQEGEVHPDPSEPGINAWEQPIQIGTASAAFSGQSAAGDNQYDDLPQFLLGCRRELLLASMDPGAFHNLSGLIRSNMFFTEFIASLAYLVFTPLLLEMPVLFAPQDGAEEAINVMTIIKHLLLFFQRECPLGLAPNLECLRLALWLLRAPCHQAGGALRVGVELFQTLLLDIYNNNILSGGSSFNLVVVDDADMPSTPPAAICPFIAGSDRVQAAISDYYSFSASNGLWLLLSVWLSFRDGYSGKLPLEELPGLVDKMLSQTTYQEQRSENNFFIFNNVMLNTIVRISDGRELLLGIRQLATQTGARHSNILRNLLSMNDDRFIFFDDFLFLYGTLSTCPAVADVFYKVVGQSTGHYVPRCFLTVNRASVAYRRAVPRSSAVQVMNLSDLRQFLHDQGEEPPLLTPFGLSNDNADTNGHFEMPYIHLKQFQQGLFHETNAWSSLIFPNRGAPALDPMCCPLADYFITTAFLKRVAPKVDVLADTYASDRCSKHVLEYYLALLRAGVRALVLRVVAAGGSVSITFEGSGLTIPFDSFLHHMKKHAFSGANQYPIFFIILWSRKRGEDYLTSLADGKDTDIEPQWSAAEAENHLAGLLMDKLGDRLLRSSNIMNIGSIRPEDHKGAFAALLYKTDSHYHYTTYDSIRSERLRDVVFTIDDVATYCGGVANSPSSRCCCLLVDDKGVSFNQHHQLCIYLNLREKKDIACSDKYDAMNDYGNEVSLLRLYEGIQMIAHDVHISVTPESAVKAATSEELLPVFYYTYHNGTGYVSRSLLGIETPTATISDDLDGTNEDSGHIRLSLKLTDIIGFTNKTDVIGDTLAVEAVLYTKKYCDRGCIVDKQRELIKKGQSLNMAVDLSMLEVSFLSLRLLTCRQASVDLLGQAAVSLVALREGYRKVPLYNSGGEQLPPRCFLFVKSNFVFSGADGDMLRRLMQIKRKTYRSVHEAFLWRSGLIPRPLAAPPALEQPRVVRRRLPLPQSTAGDEAGESANNGSFESFKATKIRRNTLSREQTCSFIDFL